MNKALLLTILTFTFIIGVYIFMKPVENEEATEKEAKIHYHAGFLVYVDGKRVDFSDSVYMDATPCPVGETEAESEPPNEELERAHLHDGIGDVVHVEAEGAKWANLFENIGYEFPHGKTVQGYIGGKPVENILNEPIEPDESIIITAGSSKNIGLETYVTKTHIDEVGAKSEGC